MNTLSKWNNSVILFLESPIIKYGFLIFIVVQILLIKHLNTSYLRIFDDNLFKIIYAFIIAYYACFDPIYAIALTTLMIISIQELHSRNATHSILSLLPEQNINSYFPKKNNTTISSIKYNDNINSHSPLNIKTGIINEKMTATIFDNDELVYELINKQSLQKKPSSGDKLTSEYQFCQEPAYKTITDNITESSKNESITYDLLNKNVFQRLNDIQSNQGLTADQNKSLQGLKGDILNIQGLPNGFDNTQKLTNL